MDRRGFVRLAGAAALAPTLPLDGRTRYVRGPAAPWPGYDAAMVIDALASPIQFNIPQGGLPLRGADLNHARRSGITAVNLTVGVVGATAAEPYEGTLARLSGWDAELDAHPDVLRSVRSVADLRDAKATGRLGIIYGFQDTVPLEGQLGRIELFHERGVRIVQLTYNDRNRLGDGCLEPGDGGLSRLGMAAVERMGELGVLVDLSHCSARTTKDGIQASAHPVSVTHSGCNAVFRHPRNKDDATLRALADRGGVMGVYLMPFVNASGAPTAADVMAHLDHALDVCGEDHVGIGSDQGITPLDVSGDFPRQFDAVSARRSAMGIAAPREDTVPYVPELNHPRRMESIADLMAARGHGDRVIEKVLGTNWIRLFSEVWG